MRVDQARKRVRTSPRCRSAGHRAKKVATAVGRMYPQRLIGQRVWVASNWRNRVLMVAQNSRPTAMLREVDHRASYCVL